MLGWFNSLSLLSKIGVASLASVGTLGTIGVVTDNNASTTPPPEPPAQTLPVETEKKTVKETEEISFKTIKQDAPYLNKGVTQVVVSGVNGIRTITYEVTYTNGTESDRVELSSKITKKPVDKIVKVGTYVAPVTPPPTQNNCDPNYSGCVPIASDVDCGGGSGNGPAYFYGTATVTGYDIYDLDRDNDGYACE